MYTTEGKSAVRIAKYVGVNVTILLIHCVSLNQH